MCLCVSEMEKTGELINLFLCCNGYLQYAFYFLVVGAAIWASSWAGNFGEKLGRDVRFFLINLNLNSNLQKYRAGCGQGRGNRRR